jgi:MerR family transcriptional regulator, copper efflux regulator
MRIGELAKQADVTPDTVRYYEKEGLLAAPPRTSSGYRDYDPSALKELTFIRKASTLGLKLAEVKEVLALTDDGQVPCDHVRNALTVRLDDVERRMSEMRALRATLREALARFEEEDATPPGCRCAVIEGRS